MSVVVFDVFQGFFDLGANYVDGKAEGFLMSISSELPLYLLHSLVSLAICFVLLLYMDEHSQQTRWRTASAIPVLTGAVTLASIFYAATMVPHTYKGCTFGPCGLDYAVAIIVINVSAALMALGCAAFCKRQAWPTPDGEQVSTRRDLPSMPLIQIPGGYIEAQPAPAASIRE